MHVLAPPVAAPLHARAAPSARRARRAPPPLRAAATDTPSVSKDAYIAVGKAHCFQKIENKLQECFIIEPITAASLESMAAGAPTSFVVTTGVTVGDALANKLPADFAGAAACEDFQFRVECAARTWMRPHPQESLMGILPLGTVRKDFNFSISDKRVLNPENEVSDSDNIKQDISIDVYGRKEDEAK